jgi:outer membrane protein assembly factor BamB
MNASHSLLFIGVGGSAVAVDRSTGTEIWRTKLKSTNLSTIHFDGENLFAGSAGEVFRLDPSTGEVIWHNKLPRLGMGVVAFPSSVEAPATAAIAQAAAAMAAST